MNANLVSETSGKALYSEKVPSSLEPYTIKGATPVVASGPFGDFLFQERKSTEVAVWYNNYLLEENDRFTSVDKQPRLELKICMNNSFIINTEGLGERELHDGSFNITYVPFVNEVLSFEAGRLYTCCTVRLIPGRLARLSYYYPFLDPFIDKMARREPAVLCEFNQLTTTGMNRIIDDILHADFAADVTQVYVDAKVMELLIILLDRIAAHPVTRRHPLRKDDLGKIYEAKEYLQKNISKKITLRILSKKVGLNTNKLKNGFLYVYDCTVAVFLLHVRMKEAVNLLTTTERSIDDIADATGYANAAHFSKAFKKYYKNTPAQCRRQTIKA